jgi:hypothetical protein
VVPTFEATGPFERDLQRLDARQLERFRNKIREDFVPALQAGALPPDSA